MEEHLFTKIFRAAKILVKPETGKEMSSVAFFQSEWLLCIKERVLQPLTNVVCILELQISCCIQMLDW